MALPRKLIYPAVFSYDDGICVYFPDVDGCYSQADSTEEAFYMAKDALELVLEDYIFNMFEMLFFLSTSKMRETRWCLSTAS